MPWWSLCVCYLTYGSLGVAVGYTEKECWCEFVKKMKGVGCLYEEGKWQLSRAKEAVQELCSVAFALVHLHVIISG